MRYSSKILASLFFFIFFATFLETSIANNYSIPPFQAEYQIKHNGIEIGRVTLSLKKTTPNNFELKSITETSGMLSFIRDDAAEEISNFEISNQRPRPTSYQYKEHLGDGRKNVSLTFDWQGLNVTNRSKGTVWKLAISDGVLDKALMQIALMQDLNTDKTLTYEIADGGKLKTYRFKTLGTEKIKIKGSTYQTVKLARKKGDKPLITYYWCAPELHNLPILLQRKKTYGTFEMRLIKASFDG